MSKLRYLARKLRGLTRKISKRRRRNGKGIAKLIAQRHRIRRKVRYLKRHRQPPLQGGAAEWRGVQVAPWMVGLAPGPDGEMVNWLQRSVAHGWDGRVVSGYRSPEYSRSLCRSMCGADSCPGRCAGTASNHVGLTYPNGAIDVYPDYVRFTQIQRDIGSPLRNNLPNDRNHFSVSGG